MNAPRAFEATEGGRACVLSVRVQPGASRNAAAGAWNGMLKIAVSAPPLDGRANRAARQLVAEIFELEASAVTLVAGETSRIKRFRLDAPSDRIRARLAELLD